jgi:hypothetical protein
MILLPVEHVIVATISRNAVSGLPDPIHANDACAWATNVRQYDPSRNSAGNPDRAHSEQYLFMDPRRRSRQAASTTTRPKAVSPPQTVPKAVSPPQPIPILTARQLKISQRSLTVSRAWTTLSENSLPSASQRATPAASSPWVQVSIVVTSTISVTGCEPQCLN